MRITPLRLLAGTLGLFMLCEVALRLSGAVDFPVYHVDGEIGYIPEANQAGRFLRVHSWVYNDRNMGTELRWNPAERANVLLIGNSIVMGGNPFDQKEKLGPQLQQLIGPKYAVWPIASGGWTTVNEMAYLKRNPDVADSPTFFIWEYMAGGLSASSQWRGDYVFPSKHPLCATCYVVRRYVWPRIARPDPSELPPVGAIDARYRDEFETAIGALSRAAGHPHPGILFLYPAQADYAKAKQGKEWLPERSDIERIAASNGLLVVDIASQPEWSETLYRADRMHPTPQGNAVLAEILMAAVKRTLFLTQNLTSTLPATSSSPNWVSRP